jgi:hypothetical protein
MNRHFAAAGSPFAEFTTDGFPDAKCRSPDGRLHGPELRQIKCAWGAINNPLILFMERLLLF